MQGVYAGKAETLLEAAGGLQAEREAPLACTKDVPGEGHSGGDGLPQEHVDRVQGVVGQHRVAGAEEICFPSSLCLSFVSPLSFLCLSFVAAFAFMMVRQEEDQEHPIGVRCHIAHHHRG